MPSRKRPARRRSRAFFWANVVAVIVILLAAGYSYAWFHYAGRLEDQAKAVLANLNGPGVRTRCDDIAARGYPVELGLFCSHVSYRDETAHVSVDAGAFHSGAALYSPLDIVGNVESPAKLTLPQVGVLAVDWKSLAARIHLATPLPALLRIAGHDVAVAPEGAGQATTRVDRVAFEARPVARTDLNLVFRFAGLASTRTLPSGAKLPAFDGAADITIKDGVTMMMEQRQSLRGTDAVLNTVALKTGEGSVALSGPVSVDENGLVSGQLSLSLKNPQALAGLLADAAPQMRGQIENAMPALAALGDGATLPLRIDAGKAYLAFIPLGTIPPL